MESVLNLEYEEQMLLLPLFTIILFVYTRMNRLKL